MAGSSQAQGQTVMVRQFSGAAGEYEKRNKKNRSAARSMILLRSNEGDERTKNQSSDEAPDVSGIIGKPETAPKTKLKITNTIKLRSGPESAARGTENSPSLKAAISAPASPKIAPEAPTLIT